MSSDSYTDTGPQNTSLTERLFKIYRVPGITRLEDMLRRFSPAERMALYGFAIVMGICAFTLLAMVNSAFTTTIPSRGGSLTEGVVGTPRFINPLLAQSNPDRDLTKLVYSGLMRATPDNHYVKDLASDISIDSDGTVYTFTIRDDAYFQDGTPVTSADVAYTIAMAQNPDIKSPQRADWDGVTVETPDNKTVKITLPHPYAPFLENAALGILPKHLWQGVSADEFPFNELNTRPVGSGPFMFRSMNEDAKHTPVVYALSAFPRFTLGEPYLKSIVFHFYPNNDELFAALSHGTIETASVAPENMTKLEKSTVLTTPLPRIFGVFFNQTKSKTLTDGSVRKALALSLDKNQIIKDNLFGYGVAVDGPMLPAMRAAPGTTSDADLITKANSILDLAGWKVGDDGIRAKKNVRLTFSIATADTPELAGTANAVARTWKLLGAEVTVKVFSTSDLTNTVIRPREYDALLFGEQVGRSVDLYSFWHSSQRNDPGLNLALYTNVQADKLLAAARREVDSEKRMQETQDFADIIMKEHPAVFLYAPEFVYVIPKDLKGVSLGSLTSPAERFLNVYEWHRQTERVWDIFIPQEQKPITY